jgi:hypothetical protein
VVLRRQLYRLVVVLAVGGVAVGVAVALAVHPIRRSAGAGPSAPAPVTSTVASAGPDTVGLAGTGDIHFGATAEELATTHGLRADPAACMPRFTEPAYVHPILVDGKLAVLTVEPPAHTPEGIGAGATVASVRTVYPGAEQLRPAQPYAYSGLLVSAGDTGYLFLYSDDTVRRVLVGYVAYLRQIFAAAFPTC